MEDIGKLKIWISLKRHKMNKAREFFAQRGMLSDTDRKLYAKRDETYLEIIHEIERMENGNSSDES